MESSLQNPGVGSGDPKAQFSVFPFDNEGWTAVFSR